MGTGLSQTHLARVMEENGSEGSYRSLGSGVTAVPVEHRLWRPAKAARFPRTCGTPMTTWGLLLALLQTKIPLLHSLKKGRWGREMKSKGFELSRD